MLQSLPATITDALMPVLDVTEKTTAGTIVTNKIAVSRRKKRVVVKKGAKPSEITVKIRISLRVVCKVKCCLQVVQNAFCQ